jgi:hypothetical protein
MPYSLFMKHLLFLLFISFFWACGSHEKKATPVQPLQEPLVIEPFYAVNQISGHDGIRPPLREGIDSSVLEYYLINTPILNDSIISVLDSFTCSLLGKRLVKYNQYMFTFYRKSDQTNNEYLLEHTRTLARYSYDNDLLIIYIWGHNKPDRGSKEIYENGIVVKYENLDCFSIPSSKHK